MCLQCDLEEDLDLLLSGAENPVDELFFDDLDYIDESHPYEGHDNTIVVD